MSIQVSIPTPLRGLTGNRDEVEAAGANITEIIADLEKNYPGIRDRLVDDKGSLRRFVNIYVNGEDVRFLQDKETSVKEGDEISIVPAIAGG
ncbi:MAG: MoaD/ThiS family protein [Methylacidiphilales bacterium]|nr:MoaD/ThiS family protein [Candidatus Methylacidiphilales bacterium]